MNVSITSLGKVIRPIISSVPKVNLFKSVSNSIEFIETTKPSTSTPTPTELESVLSRKFIPPGNQKKVRFTLVDSLRQYKEQSVSVPKAEKANDVPKMSLCEMVQDLKITSYSVVIEPEPEPLSHIDKILRFEPAGCLPYTPTSDVDCHLDVQACRNVLHEECLSDMREILYSEATLLLQLLPEGPSVPAGLSLEALLPEGLSTKDRSYEFKYKKAEREFVIITAMHRGYSHFLKDLIHTQKFKMLLEYYKITEARSLGTSEFADLTKKNTENNRKITQNVTRLFPVEKFNYDKKIRVGTMNSALIFPTVKSKITKFEQ